MIYIRKPSLDVLLLCVFADNNPINRRAAEKLLFSKFSVPQNVQVYKNPNTKNLMVNEYILCHAWIKKKSNNEEV